MQGRNINERGDPSVSGVLINEGEKRDRFLLRRLLERRLVKQAGL